MNLKKLIASTLAVLALAACGNAAQNSSSESSVSSNSAASSAATSSTSGEAVTVKLGVTGSNHDVWHHVAKELKEKENIKIELVEFSDYILPNQALDKGDLDLNAFQTIIYLERFNKEQGTKVVPIGYTVIAPMGVYSEKLSSLDELKDGDTIAIPDDTSNSSRALRLLHAAGIIKLSDPDNVLATQSDIVENPLNIQLVELPASQTARSLQDVAAAVVNSGMAVEAGLLPTRDAKFLEEVNDSSKPYYNVIAAREGDKDNEVYQKVVAYYQTAETAKVIEEVTKGASIPVWEHATLD